MRATRLPTFTLLATVLLQFGPAMAAQPGRVNAPGHLPASGAGSSVPSPLGRVTLAMQPDCNLVMYDEGQNHRAIWTSKTNGKGSGCSADMQADGNLVVYDASHRALWSSGSQGHPNSYLAIQDDGNLVVYSGGKSVWAAGSSAHGEFVKCQAQPNTSPASTGCAVFEPNVKQPQTDYPAIHFNPADSVRIDASGCVQTGGVGKTWKDYVNPKGDNAPRLYQGKVKIPGVLNDLTAIANINGKTMEIPAGVDPRISFLTLGYSDDNYSDNGYYSHDDGNDDQCKGKGPAFVMVTITPNGQNFTLSPKFEILTLLYAPPGCTSTATVKCAGGGSVDYGAGSSTGTKVSTSHTFKDGFSATASAGIPGIADWTVSGGFTKSKGDSSSQTISKTTSYDLKVNGNKDGVDHDQDYFVLLLNPEVALEAAGTNVQWNTGFTPPTAQLYELPVGWIKHRPAANCNVGQPSPGEEMPCNVAHLLAQHGFNDADYNVILAQDPFANGSTAINGARYTPTTWSLPYEPASQSPDCNGGVCSCPTFATTIKNDFQTEQAVTTSTDITLGLTQETKFIIGLKLAGNFTWTNSSSDANTAGSTQSATAAVTCPSAAYTGPTQMAIYWDSLYGSFVFAPMVYTTDALLHHGQILDAAGKPVAGKQVDMTANGKTFHTVSDAKGEYRFLPPTVAKLKAAGTGALSVGNVRQTVQLLAPTATEIHLNP